MPPPQDDPSFDPHLILAVLSRHQVEHMVVGGFSIELRGVEMGTMDLDCLPATDQENLERLAAALNELGARFRVAGLTDMESKAITPTLTWRNFSLSGSVATLRTDAGDLDVLIHMEDGSGERHGFDHYRPRATQLRVGSSTVLVAALQDVIASKEHADRDKDRLVLPKLRALLERDGRASG